MCGIAGIYHPELSSADIIEPQLLQAMAASMMHRGPDEEGFHQAPGIGLAFRRLAIVDIQHGQQPLYNGNRTIVAVVNGEIYNHAQLRSQLQARGVKLHSHSDVEVVPHLYELYGEEFVKQLKGQFAIALYDSRQHKLMLARDGVGIAPLFWSQQKGKVLFGSEVRTILCSPWVKKEVNLTAVDQLLTFPGVVSPHTFFAGIHSVKPGHYITFTSDGMSEHCYWDLNYPTSSAESPLTAEGLEHCLDHLNEHLRQAVERRLQGDVPIGVYLSGGLDSSLIAALVKEVSPDKVRDSFSITFSAKNIDESRYQRLMAEHLGTRHHSFEVQPKHIAEHLHQIVNRAEMPLRESYNACSLILSGLVRSQGIKAVVSGEGADELFAGYVGYRLQNQRMPEGDGLEAMLESEMRGKLWGDPQLFYEKSYHEHREQKIYLFSEAVQAQHQRFDCLQKPLLNIQQIQGRHPVHQRSYLDFKLRMADHLLADHGDRVAFANSVEGRYPFLDDDLIDYVTQIPPQWLLHHGEEKYLLKQLSRRYLPEAITERQKFSFVAPSSASLLRQHSEIVGDILAPERIRRQGYFDPDTVEYLRQSYLQPEHQLNQTFEDDLLMIVLTFGIWLDEFDMPDYSA